MIVTIGLRSVGARLRPRPGQPFHPSQLRTKSSSRLAGPYSRAQFSNKSRGKTSITQQRTPSSTRSRTLNKRQKATLATNEQPQPPPRLSVWQQLEETLRKPRTVPIPRWISPRMHTISLSEVFGHASFVLVAISYAVDDFLMLRIIAVAGSAVMLVFAYWHPYGRVLWLPFKWNALFIAINSYRIGRVLSDRYMAEQLSPEMLHMRETNFYLMDHVDFAHLVQMGTVTDYKKGDLVLAQGEGNRYVRLVLDGEFQVLRDGKLTYMLDEGNFISESGLHVGLLLHGKVESCCTVVANTDARVICWDRSELVDKMRRDLGFRRSIKGALSWDIIRKLKSQRLLLKSGLINDPKEWTERRDRQTQHRYAAILHNLLQHPRDLKERRKELLKYRKIHHIDDDYHNRTLELLGWTPEDFEHGLKNGQNPLSDGNEEETEERNWKWYLYDLYLRVVG